MSADDLREAPGEHGQVERAGELDRRHHVVDGIARVQPVEQPEPLLTEGEGRGFRDRRRRGGRLLPGLQDLLQDEQLEECPALRGEAGKARGQADTAAHGTTSARLRPRALRPRTTSIRSGHTSNRRPWWTRRRWASRRASPGSRW